MWSLLRLVIKSTTSAGPVAVAAAVGSRAGAARFVFNGPFPWNQLPILRLHHMAAAAVMPLLLLATNAVAAHAVAASGGYDRGSCA